MKRRTRIGARARRRILAGGPRATGRRAASVAEWAAIRELVLARARWVCQACGLRRRLDVHHVVKRSQGSSDFDLNRLVALCRSCHDRTDVPYSRGRLVITPLGLGAFRFEMVQRAENWTRTRPAGIEAGVVESSHETGPAAATVEATSSLPMWANQSAVTWGGGVL
jgi:5-methylcytosine-specific restriction endonuclease McrA